MIVNVQYKVFWQFKENHDFKVTKCKKIINCKKGTLLKQTIRGGSVGYWIDKKFIKRTDLNNHIELIKKPKLPF
jgi:hypothetical protein